MAAYLALPQPAATAMFDCLYATLPAAMADQLDTARREAASRAHDTGVANESDAAASAHGADSTDRADTTARTAGPTSRSGAHHG